MNVLNFDSQQCERIRRQLDSYLSDELLVETTGEVLRHLEACEACSRELETRLQVRNALRKAVRKQLPPDQLRLAIHQRLTKAQPGFFARFHAVSWAAAVAGVIVVVLAGLIGQQWRGLQQERRMVAGILTLGVSDHLYCAIQSHNYRDEGRPADQLLVRLGPDYAGLLDVVQQLLPGFQVLEAHRCSVPGSPRKYVHFIASGKGTILSVILTKRNGENLPNGKLLVADASSGVNLYKAHRDGMSVAGFESNDYFGFVVSDLGQSEMLQLAAGLAPAIRIALPASARDRESELTGAFFAGIAAHYVEAR
jgi:anti-sigma factor (TIGR02949 family)